MDRISLQAVWLDSFPTADRVDDRLGPGVRLPDGAYIFAHRRGLCVYRDTADVLRANPGMTIHRAIHADESVNPAEQP